MMASNRVFNTISSETSTMKRRVIILSLQRARAGGEGAAGAACTGARRHARVLQERGQSTMRSPTYRTPLLQLALAIRDIKDEYDYIAKQGKQDMESWYKLKVSEVQVRCHSLRDQYIDRLAGLGEPPGRREQLPARGGQAHARQHWRPARYAQVVQWHARNEHLQASSRISRTRTRCWRRRCSS